MGASLVMVTFPSLEEARSVGRALVEARLAASVNIAEGMEGVTKPLGGSDDPSAGVDDNKDGN